MVHQTVMPMAGLDRGQRRWRGAEPLRSLEKLKMASGPNLSAGDSRQGREILVK